MTNGADANIETQDAGVSARRTTLVVLALLTVIAVGALLPIVDPSETASQLMFVTPAGQVALFIQGLVWLVPLLVAMERDPNGRFWKLIFTYVVVGHSYVLAFTGIPVLWTLSNLFENVAIGVLLHLLLAFPTGRLRDRFDRAVVGAIYGYILVFQAFEMTTREVDPLNLLAPGPAAAATTPLVQVVQWCVPILALLFGIAMWRHWRDASPAARRGLLPIVVALPLFLIGITVNVLARAYEVGPAVDFFAYGGIVALLFLFPVGFTLGELRLRFRRGRVADLVVDLGRGVPLGGLRDVLARTLDDPTMELAFTAPSGHGFVDAEGLPYTLPSAGDARSMTRIEHDGQSLGVLVHDPAIDSQDPGLVEAVVNAAALALENEALAAQVRAQLEDVRASRARIVDAGDAERRRVERDLHDGAQQRLVALALRLQVAKETTEGASALLDEATAELEVAIGEMRGLARGLHPTILTEAGLAAAIDALSERAPIPVTVQVPKRRYEPIVEATAYFVAAESLTNVARHGAATEANVTVVDDGERLIVTVLDDGRGGADPTMGTGLRGLTDRLAAVGGSLSISSPPGGGTTVRAELPLHPQAASEAVDRRATAPMHQVAGSSHTRGRWPSQPRRVPGDRSAGAIGFTVLAAIVLAMVVVGALTLGPRPIEAPILERDATFARPFDYEIPPETTLAMDPTSDTLHMLWTRDDDVAEGMSFWLVTDVLGDPCLPSGGTTILQPGPDALLAHLRGVDGLEIARQMAVTIDGRPATQLDLTVTAEHRACTFEELGFVGMSLWRDAHSPAWIFLPQGRPVPVTVLDVDGATIVIETWSYADIEAWRSTAEGIIGSIRFHHGGASDAGVSSVSPE